jgi:Cu(I)/Ag(I) efflux system membrane fusion protein
MNDHLAIIKMNEFKGGDHDKWMGIEGPLKSSVQKLQSSPSIEQMRSNFVILSKHIISIAEYFGPFDDTLYVLHCPMADSNKGADWLSEESEIRNPYFGSSMLSCGEVKREVKN